MNKVAHPIAWEKLSEIVTILREKKDYRSLLLFSASTFTGTRCSDWQKFRWEQFITRKDGIVVCRDEVVLREKKTSKKRTIYLGPDFQELLLECFKGMRIRDLSDPLFIPLKGIKAGMKDGITTNGGNKMLKKVAKMVGLPETTTTHSFRKTFGLRIYNHLGQDHNALLYVQRIFGHSSTLITIRYLGLEEERIKVAYQSLKLLS